MPRMPLPHEIHYPAMLSTLGFIPTSESAPEQEDSQGTSLFPADPINPFEAADQSPQTQEEAISPPAQSARQSEEQDTLSAQEMTSDAVAIGLAPMVVPCADGVHDGNSNPFDVQQAILDLFEKAPATQHSTSPTLEKTDMDNPFEQERPLTNTTKTPLPLAETTSPTTESDDDYEEDPFVFGNPFEGPLPDVFHHDHDLRKSIMEQTGEEIEAPIEQTRPKKKRSRKRSKPQHNAVQDGTIGN